MTVLVTGAAGFVGHHLVDALNRRGDTVLAAKSDTSQDQLRTWALTADAIVHLAGANRPADVSDFEKINRNLTAEITRVAAESEKRPTIVFSSSTQAASDNSYGTSKRQGEAALDAYAQAGGRAVVFRFPNIFGKESRPFYNTVVATFCHNVARGEPCSVSDPSHEITFVYIDDVVAALLNAIDAPPVAGETERRRVETEYRRTLGQLLADIESFREMRVGLKVPDFSDRFLVSLYATYLSFLPTGDFAYSLVKREDERGSLAEFIKSDHFGQVFVSRTRPGITRGNHFHHTKTEKFLVLEGEGLIRFRHVGSDEVLEYRVKGDEYRVVDIPPGYTHSIENIGHSELVTLFWASEIFDPQRMDTIFEAVQ
ncbi:MAG: SDR family oxidoreductase [Verrucomicrobiaceae bacterium]|nr:MAG: SDR family oxidoreductase [Verrucomicrobiaceae bacterium]